MNKPTIPIHPITPLQMEDEHQTTKTDKSYIIKVQFQIKNSTFPKTKLLFYYFNTILIVFSIYFLSHTPSFEYFYNLLYSKGRINLFYFSSYIFFINYFL